MEVSVPIWNQQDCQNSFVERIGENVLCAGAREGGRDSCQVNYPFMIKKWRIYEHGKNFIIFFFIFCLCCLFFLFFFLFFILSFLKFRVTPEVFITDACRKFFNFA